MIFKISELITLTVLIFNHKFQYFSIVFYYFSSQIATFFDIFTIKKRITFFCYPSSYYFYAFFATSAISVKAFGSVTAISANIFLLIVTFAFFNPAIILL